jgi:hypothetical protein
MKKPEAEKAIRALTQEWAATLREEDRRSPLYGDFKEWAARNGYGRCFKFRAVGGADYIAEMWFDQELGQSWRN